MYSAHSIKSQKVLYNIPTTVANNIDIINSTRKMPNIKFWHVSTIKKIKLENLKKTWQDRPMWDQCIALQIMTWIFSIFIKCTTIIWVPVLVHYGIRLYAIWWFSWLHCFMEQFIHSDYGVFRQYFSVDVS